MLKVITDNGGHNDFLRVKLKTTYAALKINDNNFSTKLSKVQTNLR